MLQPASSAEYDTADIVAKDKAHFTHPWQIFDTFSVDGAQPIQRGEGCYIGDTDGKPLRDANLPLVAEAPLLRTGSCGCPMIRAPSEAA